VSDFKTDVLDLIRRDPDTGEHDEIRELWKRHSKAEGADLGWWILLDYVDVVIHILQPEAREYYALDALYGECPELDVSTVPLPAGIDAPLAAGREEPLRMAE